jgi:hypothetical protein
MYHGDFRDPDEALAGARSVTNAIHSANDSPHTKAAPGGGGVLTTLLSQGTDTQVRLARETAGPKQDGVENNSHAYRQEARARSAAIFCRKR